MTYDLHRNYWCFLSYAHCDNHDSGRQWATWLHHALETYEIPQDLVGELNGRGEEIPERLFPIFRDEEELSAGDLSQQIRHALDRSRTLVVICSPRAVHSRYVREEIRYYKSLGRSASVFAAMIEGVPDAHTEEEKNCFPDVLRDDATPSSRLDTAENADPLAADFRIQYGLQGWTSPKAYREALVEEGLLNLKEIDERVEDFRNQLKHATLQLISGIIALPLATLTRRDKEYQLALAKKRARIVRRWLTAVTVLAVIATTLGILAELARRAEHRQNMNNIARKLAAEAINEAARLEHEKAALLARQAYLINKRHRGDSISQVDHALRTVLNSPNYNLLLPTVFEASPRGPEFRIRSIAYGPNNGTVAIAGDQGIGILSLREENLTLRRLHHTSLIRPALAMSPDGTKLAVVGSEKGVLVYELHSSEAEPTLLPIDGGRTSCVAYGHEGQVLAVGTDNGTIHSWDLSESEPVHRVVGHMPGLWINAMAFSSDSKQLVTAGKERSIVLWDLDKNEHLVLMKKSRSQSRTSLDFSPDGLWLAATSISPACVWIWRTDQLEGAPLTHKISSPLAVKFTADARNLIVGNGLGSLYLWRTDQLDSAPISLDAHRDEIRSISDSPMDPHFITGSADGALRIWEPYSDIEVTFRWSPDGTVEPVGPYFKKDDWLAFNSVVNAAISRTTDGTLQLHRNPGRKEQVTSLGVNGNSAVFSPTGRFLAIGVPSQTGPRRGASEHEVFIWDLQNSSPPLRMKWGVVSEPASFDGIKAVPQEFGLVEVYQTLEPSGEAVILESPGSRYAPSIAFSPNGKYLLTMSKPSEKLNVARFIRIYASSTQALAEEVSRRVSRNLSPEEWRRFVGTDTE